MMSMFLRWFDRMISLVSARFSSSQGTDGLEFTYGFPDKIHLIPDRFHIKNVGRLEDGRLFLIDSQLSSSEGITTDYVCTFIFDADGQLVDHTIDRMGARDSYTKASYNVVFDKHIVDVGRYEKSDIWIQPFEIVRDDIVFGFIPRSTSVEGSTDPEDWRVEFMPGNTLSFYDPWELGKYDT